MGFNTPDQLAAETVLQMIFRGELSIVSGGHLAEFETRTAQFWGNKLGLAFSSGTSAIHAALYALGVSPGEEVIVPTYGFHAMVTPVLLLGATPVFCDVSPETFCLEVDDVEKVRTSQTKGVIALYPWGNPPELQLLRRYTTAEGLFLLGDASHAHGASLWGQPLGAYADITCASYGRGKLITGGELGCATTDSVDLWDRMALFCHINRVPKDLKTNAYSHFSNAIGPKYRPHGLALPIALHQMDTYSERLLALMHNISELVEVIRNTRTLSIQDQYPGASRVYWKIPILTHSATNDLVTAARAASLTIERDHYFPLLHEDPNYRDHFRLPGCFAGFPKAETLIGRVFQIPAMNLYDRELLSNYCEFFRAFDMRNTSHTQC